MKSYIVQFRLWDITNGERTGELLEESNPVSVSPMRAVLSAFDDYAADCPVSLKPLSLGAVRVGLSRSSSGRLIIRRRFDFEGSKYMLATHIEGPPRAWSVYIPYEEGVCGATYTMSLDSDGAPVLHHAGAWGLTDPLDLTPLRAES